MTATKDGEWCVVANVKAEAYGRATSAGSRLFPASAKLWCLPPAWGDGYENIRVIGRGRGSSRHIQAVVRSAWLVNWRARVAYHPGLLEILRGQIRRWADQEACENTARFMATQHPPIDDLRDRARRLQAALHLLAAEERGRALEALAQRALATWTERTTSTLPPVEICVLADWLEERGVGLPIDQLVTTLDRRRINAAGSPPPPDRC